VTCIPQLPVTRIPAGVLMKYPDWDALPLLAVTVERDMRVLVDAAGNIFFPKKENEDLDPAVLDIRDFSLFEQKLRWLRWLAEAGLCKEPERTRLTGPEGGITFRDKVAAGVYTRLVEFGTEGSHEPLKLVDVEEDLTANMANYIGRFFKRFPWMKLWTDPVTGVLYDIRVSFDMELVEVRSGRRQEEVPEAVSEDRPGRAEGEEADGS